MTPDAFSDPPKLTPDPKAVDLDRPGTREFCNEAVKRTFGEMSYDLEAHKKYFHDMTQAQKHALLHYFAEKGDVNHHFYYLISDPEINRHIKDQKGNTALQNSIRNDHYDISHYLIDSQSSNIKDNDGKSPLHVACEKKHVASVRSLLQHNGNPLAVDVNSETPIQVAIRNQNMEVLHTVMNYASEIGAVEVVKHLLENYQSYNDEGRALFTAVENNQETVAQCLIAHGYDVNQKRSGLGTTPLHTAALAGATACVKLLLSSGANAAIKDIKGRTPRRYSASGKNLHIDEILRRAEQEISTAESHTSTESRLSTSAALRRQDVEIAASEMLGRRPQRQGVMDRFMSYFRLRSSTSSASPPAQINTREVTQLSNLKSANAEVRIKAAKVLGREGDSSTIPVLRPLLKDWHAGAVALESLERLGWKATSNSELIYVSVIKRHTGKLRRNQSEVIDVLINDVKTATEYRVIENALFIFIGLAWKNAIPLLIDTLSIHGNNLMAEAYLNCGYPDLATAAEQWAIRNGYQIRKGPGASPVRWGRF